jgi:hypothetical protein
MAVTTQAAPRAGYSGKSLAAKLGLAAGMRVRVVGAPAGYRALAGFDGETLREMPRGKSLDFVHAFFADRASLARALPGLASAIAPGGMIWVSWRKKTAAPESDLDENGIRAVALPLGLVDTKVCAVDPEWSALKLVWRRERRWWTSSPLN